MKKDLELRNKLKKKKPVFLKQDAHKKAKLAKNWRQPKGRHSKMRLKLASYRKQPSAGYSSPKTVRGLNALGLKEVKVESLKDLENIKKDEGVVIGKTVGQKKKVEILKRIQEMKNITVINIKNIEEFIKESEKKLKSKKEESKEREEEKKKSKEEALKRAEEKKKEEEKKTEEAKDKEEEDQEKKEARQKAMQQPIG